MTEFPMRKFPPKSPNSPLLPRLLSGLHRSWGWRRRMFSLPCARCCFPVSPLRTTYRLGENGGVNSAQMRQLLTGIRLRYSLTHPTAGNLKAITMRQRALHPASICQRENPYIFSSRPPDAAMAFVRKNRALKTQHDPNAGATRSISSIHQWRVPSEQPQGQMNVFQSPDPLPALGGIQKWVFWYRDFGNEILTDGVQHTQGFGYEQAEWVPSRTILRERG